MKIPFTLGYNIVGDVDAIGAGVTEVAVGDRVAVAATTITGILFVVTMYFLANPRQ